MSKYNIRVHQKPKERKWKVHPFWRGFGCLWLILLPIMSFAGAKLIVRADWLPLSAPWIDRVDLPTLNYWFMKAPIDLDFLISWLPEKPLLNAELLFFAAFIFLGFGAMSILYAFLYRIFGPPRSVFDDPNIQVPKPPKRIR